jgi:hypothetical protein
MMKALQKNQLGPEKVAGSDWCEKLVSEVQAAGKER